MQQVITGERRTVLLENLTTSWCFPRLVTVGSAETKAGSHILIALCRFFKCVYFGSLGKPVEMINLE